MQVGDEQESFGLDDKQTGKVDEYEFEPIKGYPMLNWRGKRPFTSTQFYPAQLKEQFGQSMDEWRDQIYWGDNLQVLSHLLRTHRGGIDLIYIDPPFDSKADYKQLIEVRGQSASNDQTNFEEKQYSDIWNNDEFLQFMFERIILAKELLSDKGSIFLHCDWHKSHHLRMLLDEVFGPTSFVNEISWCYSIGGKGKKFFARKHDTILYYSKSPSKLGRHIFNSDSPDVRMARKPNSHMKLVSDAGGRQYQAKVDKKSGKEYRYYMDEGKIPEDYWTDIEQLNWEDKERVGYPTQKPEALLKRIVAAGSNEGSTILDFFMGSGTLLSVGRKLGRRVIGADINLGAVMETTKRLNRDLQISERGFELFNVNNYEIFRNPSEAKALLVEALEVQSLEAHPIYDGEKDGRMVKIMPVNRIATKADLGEIVAGFDQKSFQRKQDEKPNQPVEKILLVCMGHEPDLKAELELQAKPFKIDVEVVDILRDKSQLEFKRDAEAKLAIVDDELVIENFYPMNLLQKLSLQQEQVGEWRELVDGVMVDWNYDGAIFSPTVVDVPDKDEFVSGRYVVPGNAGTIRVKITDLLSESWEGEIDG